MKMLLPTLAVGLALSAALPASAEIARGTYWEGRSNPAVSAVCNGNNDNDVACRAVTGRLDEGSMNYSYAERMWWPERVYDYDARPGQVYRYEENGVYTYPNSNRVSVQQNVRVHSSN